MTFITVASATLPSVPLDFQGNLQRILESIRLAKSKGAKLRTGPEVGGLTKTPRNETDQASWKFPDMDVLTITVRQAYTFKSCSEFADVESKVEGDTFFHSWEVVAQILNDPSTKDMLVDVGMGVRHRVGNISK